MEKSNNSDAGEDSSRSRVTFKRHETKSDDKESVWYYYSQSRDQSRDWHFSIPKSRNWKMVPGLQSLVTIPIRIETRIGSALYTA